MNVYSTASPSPPGAKFALGGAYETQPFRAEGYAGLRVLGELRRSTPTGRVSLHEYNVAGGLRALFLVDPLRFGLAGELSLNLLRASGSTPDGREGSAWLTDYSVALGPEARLRLLPILELRAFMQAQARLTSERFAVEEVFVTEISGVRTTGELSLVFWTP